MTSRAGRLPGRNGQPEDSLPALAEGCCVGIRRPVNKAIIASRASTDSAERSPSMRALAFSVTIASAVLPVTPALVSAALRS